MRPIAILLVALPWLVGCEATETAQSAEDASPTARAEGRSHIALPPALRGIASGITDQNGDPATIPCATCHALRTEEVPLPTDATALAAPHEDLSMAHGELSCASCHHPTDRALLRLADGTPIPLGAAMRLCAQCHGPQARDYRRGSHGGMQGAYDANAGRRTRKHCVACHEAHAPAFGTYEPAPPPRDRFLSRPEVRGHE